MYYSINPVSIVSNMFNIWWIEVEHRWKTVIFQDAIDLHKFACYLMLTVHLIALYWHIEESLGKTESRIAPDAFIVVCDCEYARSCTACTKQKHVWSSWGAVVKALWVIKERSEKRWNKEKKCSAFIIIIYCKDHRVWDLLWVKIISACGLHRHVFLLIKLVHALTMLNRWKLNTWEFLLKGVHWCWFL